jgi:hypothetical protein
MARQRLRRRMSTAALGVGLTAVLTPAAAGTPPVAAAANPVVSHPLTAGHAVAAGQLEGRRFVASYGSFRCPNIGVFSAPTGRLIRVLRRHDVAGLLAVSPSGRSLSYVNDPVSRQTPAACRRTARRDGTGTVLRVPLSGGRPVDTGRNASVMAVSPDGRMVAWVTGEVVVRLHVRNRVTGRTRRLLIADNHGIGNPTSVEGLAWAPGGTRLAISLAATSVITWIHVMNPWTTPQDPNTEREALGCHTSCSAPTYSPAGHLMFMRTIRSGLAAQLRENSRGRSRVVRRVDRAVEGAEIDPSGAALLTTGRLLVLDGKHLRRLPDSDFGFDSLWVPTR